MWYRRFRALWNFLFYQIESHDAGFKSSSCVCLCFVYKQAYWTSQFISKLCVPELLFLYSPIRSVCCWIWLGTHNFYVSDVVVVIAKTVMISSISDIKSTLCGNTPSIQDWELYLQTGHCPSPTPGYLYLGWNEGEDIWNEPFCFGNLSSYLCHYQT